MRQQGLEIHPGITLNLLVDTGCDTTTIGDMHLRSLGVPTRGATDIRTATTDAYATTCDTFDVELRICPPDGEPFVLPAIEVIGRPFHNETIDGLLARDVLDTFMFTLDGPNKRFMIQY
jgi:hypothetical protein